MPRHATSFHDSRGSQRTSANENTWNVSSNNNSNCIKTALVKAVSLTPSIVVAVSTIFQLFVFFNEFEPLGI